MLLRWNPSRSYGFTIIPLAKLECNLGDFRCKHNSRLCHVFDYETKMGQAIQLHLDGPLHNGWRTLGILNEVLSTFWKGLWRLHMPKKIKFFWCQISHNVTPVGEWLGKRGCLIACPLYSSPIETLRTLFVGFLSSLEGMGLSDSPPNYMRNERNNIVERINLDRSLN